MVEKFELLIIDYKSRYPQTFIKTKKNSIGLLVSEEIHKTRKISMLINNNQFKYIWYILNIFNYNIYIETIFFIKIELEPWC